MNNEGLNYLKDILSNKLHNQKYRFNSNDYVILQLSVQEAFNIVMEIIEINNLIESLEYDNKRLTQEYTRIMKEIENYVKQNN